MDYRVVITPPAKRRLDQYVSYTIDVLKSKQAARAILNDARETKTELARVAGSLRLCDDEVLNQ